MDPLSITASIIAVLQLSTKVLGYLNDVKNASKDRAQCALEVSNLYSLLLNLRFRLEDRSADGPWYTAVRALAGENGPLDQFKEALETLGTKMTDGGRVIEAGKALLWRFKKEEIAGILNRIERLKTLVDIALQMDQFKLSQAIKNDTHTLKESVTSVRTRVDDAEHRRLLDWLSTTDYPTQQSDNIRRRQKGTGKWFLDAPEVSRWLSEARASLFCPGIPGAGKTIVAAIAIDHLLKSVGSSSGISYIYCNYKNQKDVSDMLAAILKQLVQAQPSSMEPVERLHAQHANRGTRPSLDEILRALCDVLEVYSPVYVVIDALDECQDITRRPFLTQLQELQARHDIRLMTTSRFIPEIANEFTKSINLEVKASKEDVMRYVDGQIYRLPRCIQHDVVLREIVKEKIVEAVDGMFLLARLHTDSLLDKKTARSVKLTLAGFKKGLAALDNAYEDAIRRIEEQLEGDRCLAKKVLSWITFAKRPLTTAELCCALAVEPGDTEVDPENVPDVEDLVAVCAGLVVIDPESAIIRLVHYTTQEYFERIAKKWIPNPQLDITSICLTYLLFTEFQKGACATDEQFEQRLRRQALLEYAANYWGEHTSTVEEEAHELAQLLLLNSGSVASILQVFSISRYRFSGYSQIYEKESTALHVTARFRLLNLSKKLLARLGGDSTILVNKVDSTGRAPLYLAALQGPEGMVKLLLNNGADMNAQGGDGSALIAASSSGHEQIVRLLLDKGADINAQSGSYGSALYAASARGHERIVRLLLDKGADINAQSGSYGSALQAASGQGHEQIVRLLLDKGANINAQGGLNGSALQAASAAGHEHIVRFLLDNGATPSDD